jgi:hypothetical protein
MQHILQNSTVEVKVLALLFTVPYYLYMNSYSDDFGLECQCTKSAGVIIY